MFWKKWVFYFGLVVCLVMWGTLSIAEQSDELSLINLLKDKNILTQQEADELVKKINANAEKERTKIKEELKAAADKGDFLPSALQGFKFGTTIFGDWSNTTYDHKSPAPNSAASKNQFTLNRAYLTFTKDVNDWLGMNLTSDLFNATPDNGYQLRLKYAYVNLKLFGTTTQGGMIPTPSDAYDGAIWPYRMQGKHLMDDLGIQASSDLGISNQGVFGGYMDDDYLKFASKQFAGKWGGWFVGIYNGAGYSVSSDGNGNKAVSGLVYVRPLPAVPLLKGLQVAYVGNYGKSNGAFDGTIAGTTKGDIPDWEENIAQLSLQHELFTIMGQYYWGKGTKSANEENSRKAYLIDAFMRVPGAEKARVFGKYYYYDPNTHKDNDIYKTMVVGVSYDVTKEFTPFAAWERRTNGIASPLFVAASPAPDYDKFQVGFQLKF